MKLLLDTHALVWFYFMDPHLSPRARQAIQASPSDVFVSAASYWELAIKLSTRKLTLYEPFLDFIQHAITDQGFPILPILPAHAACVAGLPYHHRDPFDRLLIAQSLTEGLPLVSNETLFSAYGAPRVW